jgi:hypothetical protein
MGMDTNANGAGTGYGNVAGAGIGINNSNNGHGQQFLSSAGIDTQTLFRRARDLHSKATQPPSRINANANANTNANNGISNGSSKPMNPNLHQSINQSRAETIQNILDHQRFQTHLIVQKKIHARLQDNFISTLSSLGPVVHNRRVPHSHGNGKISTNGNGNGNNVAQTDAASATSRALNSIHAIPVTESDWNSPILQTHLQHMAPSSTNTNTSTTTNTNTLQALNGLAQQMHYTQYQNALDFFKTLTKYPITVKGRCIASLDFLSEQFRTFIMNQVKNGLNGNGNGSGMGMDINMGRGGMLGFLVKYVETEMGGNGATSSSTSSTAEERMWRAAYYALRCGDLDCLKEIFMGSNVGLDEKLMRFVQEACQSQGGSGIEKLIHVRQDVVDGVVELYKRVESRNLGLCNANGNGNGGDGYFDSARDYQLAVLGLLSFIPQESSAVQKTSEDYIFMGLWNGIRVDAECQDNVCALADNIKHYGPAHFEDGLTQSRDGWVYSMLLLLCQQIKSGVGYLAGKGPDGMCIAVHLGLALAEEGISLSDLTKNEDSSDVGDEDLASLVTAFAKSLQSASPAVALDYLICTPGSTKTGIDTKNGRPLSNSGLNQICRLILDTKAFQVLGGTMATDGSRLASGALDKYFGNRQVSEILAVVAEQSMREGKVADAAELLSLAGRYSDLLSILNRQLSSLLVTDDVNERRFWKGAAEQFLDTYLANGQTHVIQVLEKERNLSLGNTFQMLLNLMTFFDRCNENKWQVRTLYLLFQCNSNRLNLQAHV